VFTYQTLPLEEISEFLDFLKTFALFLCWFLFFDTAVTVVKCIHGVYTKKNCCGSVKAFTDEQSNLMLFKLPLEVYLCGRYGTGFIS